MLQQRNNVTMISFINFPKILVLALIRIYQKTLSFDHGFTRVLRPHGQCKFHPTCSEYTYQAIEKYGLIKGGLKGLKRIIRCHPFSKGGFDPLK
ncbi:membrane protein insertion efficiency factor YidD [Candidatus Falkowbacteria bacterium]|nr:membrane protein insertion efficiency factor YidD [Candidatus Falkowbacteria bacterium]